MAAPCDRQVLAQGWYERYDWKNRQNRRAIFARMIEPPSSEYMQKLGDDSSIEICASVDWIRHFRPDPIIRRHRNG